MVKVILGLGSNLGNKIENINTAINYLNKSLLFEKISSFYSTESLLKDNQDDYYNCVCIYKTDISVENLLILTQNIEKKMGRNKKTGYWGARNIDIDIIDYNNIIYKSDTLCIPHKEMINRSFVLYPLYEILPEYIYPINNKNIQYFVDNLKDDLNIKKLKI